MQRLRIGLQYAASLTARTLAVQAISYTPPCTWHRFAEVGTMNRSMIHAVHVNRREI